MTRRFRNDDRGQALLVTVLFLTVILGAVAITLDVAVWYREQRQAQATADAAALAGAQVLPTDPSQALTLAQQYADDNGGGVEPNGIKVSSDREPNDTVSVKIQRPAPSIFSRVFAIGSFNVHASAAARAAVPEQVWGAAPIVVNKLHPLLMGTPGCPCFGTETTLPLAKDGAPGAFGLVDFDPNGDNGVPPLADWTQNGFGGWLDLGLYDSASGAKFNGNNIRDALTARLNTELLFPVFDTLTGGGSIAQYDVIGWVAFHLDSFDLTWHGNNQIITGYFTRVLWKGIQSSTDNHLPDFGTYSVSLVN